jgi:hypothetical protein
MITGTGRGDNQILRITKHGKKGKGFARFAACGTTIPHREASSPTHGSTSTPGAPQRSFLPHLEGADLQGLLPTELPSRWCVVPRIELYQLFGVGALFGAGLGLMIADIILDNSSLRWAWPLALLAMLLQRYLLGRGGNKYKVEARRSPCSKQPEATERRPHPP